MHVTDKMEIARAILNNAGNMNVSKEMLLKLSQKVDQYIIEYYRSIGIQKNALEVSRQSKCNFGRVNTT